MRDLASGLAAALTALLIGTLIAGAAESSRAVDASKQQATAAVVMADSAVDTVTGDAAAYRAQLEEARARLSTAYADLQARDAAYRDLLATAQTNTDRLQASNQQLQDQVTQSRLLIQQAQAQAARVTTKKRDD